jgi:hypothetical protein
MLRQGSRGGAASSLLRLFAAWTSQLPVPEEGLSPQGGGSQLAGGSLICMPVPMKVLGIARRLSDSRFDFGSPMTISWMAFPSSSMQWSEWRTDHRPIAAGPNVWAGTLESPPANENI